MRERPYDILFMDAEQKNTWELARDVQPLIKAVCEGFTPDPGTSDLDNEQPIHVSMTLGEYRRAVRLKHKLEKL